MTSEYSSGMIRVTFAAIAERRQVLVAKAAILAVLTFVVTLVSNVVAFVLGERILSSQHIESSLGDAGVLRAIVFGAVFGALVYFGYGSISMSVKTTPTVTAPAANPAQK